MIQIFPFKYRNLTKEIHIEFQVDISVQAQCDGYINSQYIKTLCQDPKVKDVLILVRKWAENKRICITYKKFPSKYAITLMAIFYMQCNYIFEI